MKRASLKKTIIPFIGVKGFCLLGISISASIVLSFIEYLVAAFLLIFLFTFGFIDDSQLPLWLPIDIRTVSPSIIWGGLFVVVAMRALFQIITYQSKIMFSEGVHARFRMALCYKMLMERKNKGTIPLSTMNHYTSELFPKATDFLFHTTQLLAFLVQAVVLSLGMLYIAWRETLMGLAGIVLMGIMVLLLNRITNRIAKVVPEAQAEIERSKVRVSRNWMLIRILGIHHTEYRSLLDSVFKYYRNSSLAYFFGNLGSAVMPVFGILLFAGIAIANLYWFHTPAVDLVAFFYLFIRFLQMVASGSNMLGGIFIYHPQLIESANLLMSIPKDEIEVAFKPSKYFRLNKKTYPGNDECPTGPSAQEPPPENNAPGVEMKKVSFYWPKSEEPVLKNFSLKIDPGSQFGLKGPNGCGKTTILGLIAGFLPPASGQVLIDGKLDVNKSPEFQKKISYVGAEPYLIWGSIRDNLMYGSEIKFSDNFLMEALAMVQMDDFISSLPGGLDHIIEESGEGLSAGQKQRLTIARAFIRRPALMILDEPSANLDDTTEVVVTRVLEQFKGDCTVIIVSHKPGILKYADRVMDLSEAAGVGRSDS